MGVDIFLGLDIIVLEIETLPSPGMLCRKFEDNWVLNNWLETMQDQFRYILNVINWTISRAACVERKYETQYIEIFVSAI